MNLTTLGLAFALITFCNSYKRHYENVTSEVSLTDDLSGTVLSRRKRFVIFPDGSSFQLVFCTQNHGYLQIGNIVWFGSTAALAWELPSDPSLLIMFKDQVKPYGPNRRIDKNIYYLDEDGKVIGKVPYKRRPIVNPAFAKRSVNLHTPSIKQMHEMQKRANYQNELHERNIEFHRAGRINLYPKIEGLLRALGLNGTQCVLRTLCECGKTRKNQETFLSEIMRAVFTLPKGRKLAGRKRYDAAHGGRDCESLYPGCEDLHGPSLYDRNVDNI